MAVAFPNLQPTGRSYTPGNWPQTEFRAQNGAVTVVRFGSRRTDSELRLEFNNISDDEAALVLANYEAVMAAWDNVTFTATNGSAGASAALRLYLEESGGSGLCWRYADAPEVSSVMPGVSTVRCRFLGYLDA